MTTESVVPEVLHAWAIYLRASEEARRRGDRRTGTDHLLLALLEDPSIEAVEEAYKPKGHRKLQVTGPAVLAQILTLQPPDPAAVLLGALGVNTSDALRELASAFAQADETRGRG